MEFLDFEATVEDQVGSKDEVSAVDSLNSFIDDAAEEEENSNRPFYCNFENVTRSIDETLAEELEKSMREVEKFDEVSNFCESSEEEGEVKEFKEVEKRI